jgi:hypothetical protein
MTKAMPGGQKGTHRREQILPSLELLLEKVLPRFVDS